MSGSRKPKAGKAQTSPRPPAKRSSRS
jgi:hypothetical protein